jgi:hypothetical protein
MSRGWKAAIGLTVLVLVGLAATALILWRLHKAQPLTLTGAVIRQDADPNKELPISDVEVSAAQGLAPAASKSDSSGFFHLILRLGLRRGEPIMLQFRHPDYQPLDLKEFIGDKLYIAHMVPIPHPVRTDSSRPQSVVANVMVRYSMKSTSAVNIGSAVKTFQVVNQGDVPCRNQHPCSPDGKWKASIASASLDAGEGNEFRNARCSCIAGPCPFTRIETDGFSHGGRLISVSARDWSDTTTFLLEAEVVHPMVSDVVRDSYPVIFGQALNFTVPPTAEGVSIQAELNGTAIVFPLGPNLFLSWADCNARVNADQTKVYRCELKPGYRFR